MSNPFIYTVPDITTLITKGRPDSSQILVTGIGLYNWSNTGTVDGTSTVAANLGGYWVRQLSSQSVTQTLTEASAITWDVSKGQSATLIINSNASITLSVTNAPSNSYGSLLVKHHLAASTLVLPGKTASSFAWAVNVDGYTELSYFYDGTTFRWVSAVFDTVPVYDALTTGYAAALATVGVTLTTAQKGYIDTFVLAIKAGPGIAKFYAIYLVIGGTAAAHKFNLLNPQDLDAAYRIVFTGTPIHAATGITPASASYGDSKFAPSTGFASGASEHIAMYIRTQQQQAVPSMGVVQVVGGGGYGPEIWPRYTDDTFRIQMKTNNNIANASNTDSRGLFIATINGTAIVGYKNGTQTGTVTMTGGDGLPSNTIWLGGSNGAGSASTNEFCFASIGTGLTSGDASSLYSAVQALQTSLSRQV